MMKNNRTLGITLVLAVIGCTLIMLFLLPRSKESKTPDVGTFRLTEYQWYIDHFPSDKNVGEIDDKDTAIQAAQALWLEEYGITPEEVTLREVNYDPNEKCWYIFSMIDPKAVGGSYEAIIRDNGDVISVFQGD